MKLIPRTKVFENPARFEVQDDLSQDGDLSAAFPSSWNLNGFDLAWARRG
jgi:hypothetical protein